MNVPLNIDLQQILLHLFNFAILAFGLYFLLYKPVKDFMAKREEHYAAVDAEAASRLAEAKAAEELYRSRLDSADAEIAAKREAAAAELERISARRMDEAAEEARNMLLNAEAEALREKEKILESAKEELAGMAVSAVRKLMDESVSESYDDFLAAAERSGK